MYRYAKYYNVRIFRKALLIFFVEEILTVIKHLGYIYYPQFVNSIFELTIVTLFIYMVLEQIEYVKKLRK